jgi:hypothetical protein
LIFGRPTSSFAVRQQTNMSLKALGLNPSDPPSRFDGLAPYWRAAVEKDWGTYAVMFGTFGMLANVAPFGNQSAPTDRITDMGFDTQLQYIGDVHALTARLTYIFEHAKLDGSQPLGLSSHSSDDLQRILQSTWQRRRIAVSGLPIPIRSRFAKLEWLDFRCGVASL